MAKLYYFQAPNFSINADSEVTPKLGSIYYSLDRLTGSLNQAERLQVPPHFKNDTVITSFKDVRGKGSMITAGLNTSLLQGIAGSAALVYGFSKDKHETYQCDQLETSEFEPTEQFIVDSIAASPRVRSMLRNALPGRKRVFMITGLKIATGLSTSVSRNSQHGPMLQVGLDATALGVPAETGPEFEMAATKSRTVSTGSSKDRIVFAYRVVRIKQKGDGEVRWKHEVGKKYSLKDEESDNEEDGWDVEPLHEELFFEKYPGAVRFKFE